MRKVGPDPPVIAQDGRREIGEPAVLEELEERRGLVPRRRQDVAAKTVVERVAAAQGVAERDQPRVLVGAEVGEEVLSPLGFEARQPPGSDVLDSYHSGQLARHVEVVRRPRPLSRRCHSQLRAMPGCDELQENVARVPASAER
jgi:hypothetical protein